MNLKSANPEFSDEVNGSVSNSDDIITASSGGGVSSAAMAVKEHMFDKVVTPSDVGKLNRLVIPKQHAEKYFPLDSSTNEKGLVLNFEDRNGQPWRFRYSYWSSSQSYVMTKGWSRFVKEKSLEAGDTVSFRRAGKDRFFIDWLCRQDIPATPQFCFQRQNVVQPWSTYVLQASYSHFLLQANSNFAAHHYHPYGNSNIVVLGNPCRPRSVAYSGIAPAAVPVVQGRQASGKRLRLFGVNMDCAINSESDDHQSDIPSSNPLPNLSLHSSSSSSSIPFIELRQYNIDNYNDHKGKGSMSLDLDI